MIKPSAEASNHVALVWHFFIVNRKTLNPFLRVKDRVVLIGFILWFVLVLAT